MHRLSVTAIGRDRPGIVAAVTGVLFEQGCNLADCSMTLLGGEFAMIMLLETPDALTRDALSHALGQVAAAMDLSIHVQPSLEAPARGAGARPYVISVFGADHPGIVYRVADELARRGVNITDLMSRVSGEDVYTVVLDIDLPEGLDERTLQEDLRAMAQRVGVDLSLRPAEVDAL